MEGDLDDLLLVLANERRRELIKTLRHAEPLTINGDHADKRIVISLIHRHIPKLEQLDIIEWDDEGWSAYRGPNFATASNVLFLVEKEYQE